jgi:hypothetical protein
MEGKRSFTVKLIKAARKLGGDKYESEAGWIVYVPQYISRPNGVEKEPLDKIKVTFEVA